MLRQNNSAHPYYCGASMTCMKSHLTEITTSSTEELSPGKEMKRTATRAGSGTWLLSNERGLEELKNKASLDEAGTPWMH